MINIKKENFSKLINTIEIFGKNFVIKISKFNYKTYFGN